jgi:hypothetical protein
MHEKVLYFKHQTFSAAVFSFCLLWRICVPYFVALLCNLLLFKKHGTVLLRWKKSNFLP